MFNMKFIITAYASVPNYYLIRDQLNNRKNSDFINSGTLPKVR